MDVSSHILDPQTVNYVEPCPNQVRCVCFPAKLCIPAKTLERTKPVKCVIKVKITTITKKKEFDITTSKAKPEAPFAVRREKQDLDKPNVIETGY